MSLLKYFQHQAQKKNRPAFLVLPDSTSLFRINLHQQLIHRSAITGQFITLTEARRHPDTTVTEGNLAFARMLVEGKQARRTSLEIYLAARRK